MISLMAGSLLLLKLQRGGVDAVTQAGRGGAVVKHMPEVRVRTAAHPLGRAHEQAVVPLRFDVVRPDRLPVTRPAGAGLELRVRTEQFLSAADAAIRARFVVVPILAREGALGTLLARHPVLFRREKVSPIGVGLDHFVAHVAGGRLSLDGALAARSASGKQNRHCGHGHGQSHSMNHLHGLNSNTSPGKRPSRKSYPPQGTELGRSARLLGRVALHLQLGCFSCCRTSECSANLPYRTMKTFLLFCAGFARSSQAAPAGPSTNQLEVVRRLD